MNRQYWYHNLEIHAVLMGRCEEGVTIDYAIESVRQELHFCKKEVKYIEIV